MFVLKYMKAIIMFNQWNNFRGITIAYYYYIIIIIITCNLIEIIIKDRFFLKMIDANKQSKSGQGNIKYSHAVLINQQETMCISNGSCSSNRTKFKVLRSLWFLSTFFFLPDSRYCFSQISQEWIGEIPETPYAVLFSSASEPSIKLIL